jgi:hypothetical protein
MGTPLQSPPTETLQKSPSLHFSSGHTILFAAPERLADLQDGHFPPLSEVYQPPDALQPRRGEAGAVQEQERGVCAPTLCALAAQPSPRCEPASGS